MKLKKLLCILLIAVLTAASVIALTACKDEDAPEKITFVLDWAPNTNHVGLYVAKNLGYYAEEGLEVTFIQPGTTGCSADVSTGVGQFGIDFQEQMIYNEQSSVNVTAVAAVIQHNTSGILAKGNIDSLAALNGKKYASWGLQGEEAIVRYFLQEGGADISTVDFIPNTVENIVAEFTNTAGADCLWSYLGWDVTKLNTEGIANTFFRMSDHIPALDYYTPVIIANNDYLNDNAEYARKFIKATARGYEYAIANPREAADILMEENPELAVDSELIYASMSDHGRIRLHQRFPSRVKTGNGVARGERSYAGL